MVDYRLAAIGAVLVLWSGCSEPSDWRKVGGFGRNVEFHGIWGTAPNDVYLVGNGLDMGAVVAHFDGSEWEVLPSPGESVRLRDVWGSPGGDLWVVGDGGLFRRDGAGWVREIESELLGIHGVADDFVLAVGADEAWRYDGESWAREQDLEHDVGITDIALVDVWCESRSFAVAVGGVLECSCQANMIEHFTGIEWARLYANVDVFIGGVWGATADDIYAVGGDLWDATGSVIVHFDGHEWSLARQGEEDYFSGVWGAATDDVYAVGMGGAILHFDGTRWRTMVSGTSANLHDVWGADADVVYAVGDDGVILRRK